MIQDAEIIFFSCALKLKLISFQAMNDWIYCVIDEQETVDCPDHFFVMTSMNEHQLLAYFAEQRFLSRATPDIAGRLIQYFMHEKNISNVASFLDGHNYSKIYDIAVHFSLYGLSNRIAWMDDDQYIQTVFTDVNDIDYLQDVEGILLDIQRFIHDPNAEEWRI